MQFKCLQIFLAQMVISINIAKCKTTFFSCIDGNLFDSNDLLLWFSIFPCKLRDRKSYFPFWISEPMFLVKTDSYFLSNCYQSITIFVWCFFLVITHIVIQNSLDAGIQDSSTSILIVVKFD